MTPSNLQELLDASGNTVELLRNSQIGAYIYPVVPYEFTNWRREQRAWRETAVLFDQTHHMANLFMRGPGAIKLISDTGINSVANFPVNMAKQFVPVHAGRARDRRRHPLPPRRRGVRVGRPRAGGQLAGLPGRDGRLRRRDREGRPLALAPLRQGGHPRVLALPDPGAERLAGHREGQRRPGGAAQVLPHGRDERRRPARAHAAPRDGGRPRPGAVGPVRELRRDPRHDPRGRARVRHGAVRRPRLRLQHPGVGLDPVAAARHLHRRGAARLPRVARRRQLRGHQRAGRELRLRRHRGLLHSTRGSSATGRSSSSTTTSSGATRSSRSTPTPSATRSRSPGTARTWPRSSPRCSTSRASRYQFFDLPIANYGSSNFDSVLDPDGNVIGYSMFSGYSANEKRALSLATINPNVEIGSEVTVVWGEPDGGSRKTTVRAPPADQRARRGQPGAVLGDRAHGVRRGLAHRRRALI